MKQFWLGMISKVTEMRDKVKDKFSKNKSEIPDETTDFSAMEEIGATIQDELQADTRIEEIKVPRSTQSLKRPKPVSAGDDAFGDVEEAYEEPKPIKYREPMNVKKVVIITVLLIILGSIGAVFYYISNIDWNQHKDKIAAQFSEVTGKKIVFDGPVHLTLFPSANLTAEDIKIYNPEEVGEEPLAKIKSLVADLNIMPLLEGNFDVKMMSLVEPDIRLEMMEDGKLNWESALSAEQKTRMDNVKLILDSVMIKKAKLSFIDTVRNINLNIDSLNAEVIAQGIFGPYRIEGTYMKDNNPEGFAFSIGKLSSGFATTVNLVINQPITETFVRFDGSVLSQNNAVNGNLIFESKKLMSFVNSNFKDFDFPKEYNYPLAVNLEIKSNKTKIDLTNFVVKYGDTAGAGNLLIPLFDELEGGNAQETSETRPKIEFGFNFTDLDLTPAVFAAQKLFNKYNTGEANYNPEFKFDLLADIKAIKTRYKDQAIKDFKLSFDFVDNNINLRDFSGVLPGDTAVAFKGDIYSDLGHLSYDLDTSLKTDEFLQTLKWLEIKPVVNSDTMLRRISLNAKVAGNLEKIGINPMDLNIDKSAIKGEIGIINGERKSYYIKAASDMINFDNYLLPMPKDIAAQDFESRMNYRMQKLAFLKDFDAELDLKLDLGIYESLPFENTKLSSSLKRGVLEIKNLDISSVANAQFNVKGVIKGFGQDFSFENLKYDVDTKDFGSFLGKLDMPTPNIDLKKLRNFNSKGIATGSINRMAAKTISKLENININYGGQIYKKEANYIYNGELDVRSPDFVKMVNDFNISYQPKAFALGSFNMKGKFSGKPDYFSANPLEFNIGTNTFKGILDYDNTHGRPNIKTEMEINKLELEKFFYNNALVKDATNASFQTVAGSGKVDLWSQPVFDKTKINYNIYNKFDFDGKIKINRLNYQEYVFDFVDFGLTLKDSLAKLNDFRADYHGGKVAANLEMGVAVDKPFLKGKIDLAQYKIFEGSLVGGKYGIKDGVLDAKLDFNTIAGSFGEMYGNLSGNADVFVSNTSFVGWNISNIYKDLLGRQTSDGLTKFVKDNLQSGEEYLQGINLKISFDKGGYIIDNGEMITDNFVIKFKDNGDINAWENKAFFSVKYNKPDYLPGFEFSMEGSLSAPVLDVKTEKLAIMYNNRQAEIDAQIAREKKEVQDNLNKLMDDQVLKIKAVESDLLNVLKPELLSRMGKVDDPEVLKNYQGIEEQIKALEAELAELQLKSKTPDFTETLIKEMGEQNNAVSDKIARVRAEIVDNNLKNFKFVINDRYNKIVEQNNQAKQMATEYRSRYADLGKRLSQIQTTYKLTEDQNLKRMRNGVEGNILALDNITNSVQNDFVKMQGSKDAAALEKYANDIEMMQMDAMKYVPSLQKNIDELFVYADERIGLEEKIYKKKKEDEETRRKLEENTGSISVKGTGVSKTVVRDLAEIEKSEEAVISEDVKVIDFSEESEPTENIIRSIDKPQEIIKKRAQDEDSILVKPSGKISKASGVIIKK